MSNSEPASDAAFDARTALLALARAVPGIDSTREADQTLDLLSEGLDALSQALHQLASIHEAATQNHSPVRAEDRSARAASYRVAWELHRAAEMQQQVARTIDHAHTAAQTAGRTASRTAGREGPGLQIVPPPSGRLPEQRPGQRLGQPPTPGLIL